MNNTLKSQFAKQAKKLISLGVMLSVGTVAVFSAGAFSRRVYVNVDNQTLSTITLNTETEKILNQVGISLAPNDIVHRIDGNDGSIKLNVKRAFNVSISDNNGTVDLIFTDGTVGDALNTAGIQLGENDSVNYPLDSALEPKMNIIVSRFVTILITADGETKNYSAPEGTVNDAIGFLKIPLSADDIINVDVFSNVYEAMEIVINRVKIEEITRTEEIPFKRITKKTNLLNSGDTKIATEGKNGQKEVTVRETTSDGKVTRSEELSCKIISDPVDEVTLIGTKGGSGSEKPITTPNENEYTKVLTGSATAYTAGPGAKTASGITPKEGVVAVNFNKIPRGSKVLIKSNDGFTWEGDALDTGGALIRGSAVVDIFMDSKSKCINFGRKNVTVYIK